MKQRLERLLLTLLAAAGFLVICLWVQYRILPHEIYMPAGYFNDEVVYHRQLAGVLHSGAPQGYFGYNESTAELGTFGAWGPVVFYLYALPAFLLGGGYNVMFWCNALFMLAGWLVFALGTGLRWWQQLLFGVALLLMGIPFKYIFSGMTEALHYAILLAVLGLAWVCCRQFSAPAFWIMAALCTAGTLVRPYDAVLWVFPLAAALCHRRKGKAVVTVVGGGVSVLASLAIITWFNAPYFSGGDLDWEPLRQLKHGHPLQALGLVWAKVVQTWQEQLLPALQNQKSDGKSYWLLYALVLLTLVVLVVDWRRKRPILFKGCMLLAALSVQAALWVLYFPSVGGRHCVLLCIGLLAALVAEDARPALAVLPVLALVVVVTYGSEEIHTLPYYDADIDAELTQLNTALEASRTTLNSDDPWDNTLAYSFGYKLFHGYLYAVPAGMGIEFDETIYLENPENFLGSRYVMTCADTAVEARLLAENWQLLVETDHCRIYERAE